MFNSITVARARPLAMALHGVNIILSLSRDLNIESDEIREEFLFFHLSREGGLERSNLFERGGKEKSSFNDRNKQNQRNKLKVVGEFILGHNRSQNKIFFW